jgi:hypothetical protein
MKTQLDALYHPAGYNVGKQQRSAAGSNHHASACASDSAIPRRCAASRGGFAISCRENPVLILRRSLGTVSCRNRRTVGFLCGRKASAERISDEFMDADDSTPS